MIAIISGIICGGVVGFALMQYNKFTDYRHNLIKAILTELHKYIELQRELENKPKYIHFNGHESYELELRNQEHRLVNIASMLIDL